MSSSKKWYSDSNELMWVAIILMICFAGCNTCTYVNHITKDEVETVKSK